MPMKALLALLLLAAPALAQTNFPPLANYPAPACTRPGEPPRKPMVVNATEVDRFNLKIAEYNKRARDYVTCINLYIRNADADMDVIRRKSRDASEEANRQ